MIYTHTQFHDLSDAERIQTTLVGLRYTGDRSTMLPRRPTDRGAWPGECPFQGASGDGEPPMQLGIVPDTLTDETVDGGTVAGLESLHDFEVVYEPSELAAEILDRNSLPVAVFGGDGKVPDYPVRSVVYDRLGLADKGRQAPEAEAELRAALAEIAGIEDPQADDTAQQRSRADDLVADHTRQTLMSVAADLDAEVGGNIAGETKRELAEAITEFGPAAVRDAIADATSEE